MPSVDTFIERADKLYEKFSKTPTLTSRARKDGRALLKQFEAYLKARGLEAPCQSETGA